MNNLLTLLAILISCYLLIQILKPSKITDLLLSSFYITCALIILWGYILGLFNEIGNLASWRNIGICTIAFILTISLIKREKDWERPFNFFLRISWRDIATSIQVNLRELSKPDKFIFWSVLVASISIGAGLLYIILTTLPHDWDSMTYHLPRMAHYLQAGNLDYFDANYWAQVVHPKNSTLLLLFTYLITGRNEHLIQFPQFISFWMISISVYGVSRQIGMDNIKAIFSACISTLLISSILQANTTQNDLIISAFLGGSVYFLFTFRRTQKRTDLLLAALGITLAAGTKASFLLSMPSLIFLALALTYSRIIKEWGTNLLMIIGFGIAGTFLFVLPSGYVENYRIYGSPFGNQDVNEIHTFGKAGIISILRGGYYNFLRYNIDSISLDGLPPFHVVLMAQEALHYPPKIILPLLGINLETREFTSFSWFEYNSTIRGSYWGIFGFGLISILIILSLFQVFKHNDFFLLAVATLIFGICLAWSGPYTSDKGRFFSMSVVFATPLTGILLNKGKRWLHVYLVIVILMGCLSAISAVLLKLLPMSSNYPEFIEKRSMLEMDRLEQLTFNYQKYYRTFTAFEEIVPADASVAVFFYPNSFEYPLYGRYITRKIIPINSFFGGLQPIPSESDYLLYARGFPCPLPGDRQLGDRSSIFLRVLNKDNRECALGISP